MLAFWGRGGPRRLHTLALTETHALNVCRLFGNKFGADAKAALQAAKKPALELNL